jgi:hypothetical protein
MMNGRILGIDPSAVGHRGAMNDGHGEFLGRPSDVRLVVLIEARLATGGYVYAGRLDGEVLVTGSRDPEHDAARALLARGQAGKFWTVDAKTGRRRMLVDIAKAALLSVAESDRRGLQVRCWKGFSREDVEPPARQRADPDVGPSPDTETPRGSS